jgi:Eukaryotic glutathione synthase, ATP binding domain
MVCTSGNKYDPSCNGQMHKASGIFILTALSSDGTKTLLNEPAGYLLRTKSIESHEGGVATGYSVLDSARLV